MKKIVVRIAVVLGLACAAACGVATGQGSGDTYAGDPYTGKVSAQVLTPDGSRDPKKEFGTGSARFVPIGNGRERLEVAASIRQSNDSGFIVEGRADGSGWSGRSEALSIRIDRNGNISGGGTVNHHRITFDGRATEQRIDLVVQTEKLSQVDGGTLPVGTRIMFDYGLARSAARVARTGAATTVRPAATGKKSQKACKRRVWKMRNVATPGGGMTMTQVPHCLD